PRYVRGRRGVVRSAHGPFLLPDTNAARLSRDWEPVYAVEFAAGELWGDGGPDRDAVCVDLWESYLTAEEERGVTSTDTTRSRRRTSRPGRWRWSPCSARRG